MGSSSKSTAFIVRGRPRTASKDLVFLLILYTLLIVGALGASKLVAYLAGG